VVVVVVVVVVVLDAEIVIVADFETELPLLSKPVIVYL